MYTNKTGDLAGLKQAHNYIIQNNRKKSVKYEKCYLNKSIIIFFLMNRSSRLHLAFFGLKNNNFRVGEQISGQQRKIGQKLPPIFHLFWFQKLFFSKQVNKVHKFLTPTPTRRQTNVYYYLFIYQAIEKKTYLYRGHIDRRCSQYCKKIIF